MIKDKYGRSFKKLRLSLTQSCNFACTYCVPDSKPSNVKNSKALNSRQLFTLVKKIHNTNPLEVVRLTGGEPLLFKDLPYLIEAISGLGIEVKLTTNALLLKRRLHELRMAGLSSINVSLDAVEPNLFFKITRSLRYKEVIEGIDEALHWNLGIKLNSVIQKGINESEVLPLLTFAGDRKIPVRFLELMNMGHLYQGHHEKMFSEEAILNVIESKYKIFPLERSQNATARYWLTDNLIKFGLISNHSQPFCSDCDRLRLDSNGNIYGCISSEFGYSVRDLDDQAVKEKLKLALNQKQTAFKGSNISMKYIGG